MKAVLAALAVVPFVLASSPSPCGDGGYMEPETPLARPTAKPAPTPYPMVEPTVTAPPQEAFARSERQKRRTTAAIQSGRAISREESVRLALELFGETYGQQNLEGYLRGLWGGVVQQQEAEAITGGAHIHSGGDEQLPVWFLVLEGPFLYQLGHPLRLYTVVVMSAGSGGESRLYHMGALPDPVDVWRLENLWEYIPTELASDR